MNRFKIEFRKQQLYRDKDIEQPVIIQCNEDCSASYIDGLIPDNDWLDVSSDIDGLDDLTLTWDAATEDYTRDSDNITGNEFGSNYSKAVSAQLTFGGSAYLFIYGWLMSDACQTLNAVEVRIIDLLCNKSFRIFELKNENITYRPRENVCLITAPIREQDLTYHSFQKTPIEDDWQGWFNSDGTSTKNHPAVMYVWEKDRVLVGGLLIVAVIAIMLSLGIILLFDFGKRWIHQIFGVCFFCPSPYIRTYIENICDKYGYTHDTIFDTGEEYEDAVMFFPVSSSFKNFDNYTSSSTKFIWNNRTGYSMANYLNHLKKLFKCEWYVTPNNELIFRSKNYFEALPPIADFTIPGATELADLEYQFSGDKKPAYGRYEYKIDPIDQASGELKWRYNTLVDYDKVADNPMLEGNRTKNFEFAATGFYRDGAVDDYIDESVETATWVANLFTWAFMFILYPFRNRAVNFIKGFVNSGNIHGAVRTMSKKVNIPRILMLNPGTPIDSAKVSSAVDPASIPYYNPDNNSYYQVHPAIEASDNFFGGAVTEIFNYKLYFDENFAGNLYSEHHESDNPLKTPETNQTFTANVDLCCEMLDLFGAWDDSYAKIGTKIALENRQNKLIYGRLTQIRVDYAKGRIYLKGRLLNCGGASIPGTVDCEGISPAITSIERNIDNSVTIIGSASINTQILIYMSTTEPGSYIQVGGVYGSADLSAGINLSSAIIGLNTFIKISSFTTICDYGMSAAGAIPGETEEAYIWIGSGESCIIGDNGNTGMKSYSTLIQINTLTNTATGETKPNEIGDPDYIATVYDELVCPVSCTDDQPIFFLPTDSLIEITWTDILKARYGTKPLFQVYIKNIDSGQYELSFVTLIPDIPAPSATVYRFYNSAGDEGYIIFTGTKGNNC